MMLLPSPPKKSALPIYITLGNLPKMQYLSTELFPKISNQSHVSFAPRIIFPSKFFLCVCVWIHLGGHVFIYLHSYFFKAHSSHLEHSNNPRAKMPIIKSISILQRQSKQQKACEDGKLLRCS